MSTYAKITRQKGAILLAICDSDLLGKTIKAGGLVLEIRKEFYKGKLMMVKEALALAEKATIINLLGKNVVEEAIKEKLVLPEAVLFVAGVPHAQIVKVNFR